MSPMFLAVLLILVATFYRVMPHPENFAPLSAIAICGGMYLSKRMSLIVVLGLMLISNLYVNAFKYHMQYGLLSPQMLGQMVGFLVALFIGWAVGRKKSFGSVTGGTVAASVQFFVLSNLVSWAVDPGYAKNLAGMLQCLTVGLPGYPTTLSFFWTTLASDLIFTALFVGAIELALRNLPKSKWEWLLVKV